MSNTDTMTVPETSNNYQNIINNNNIAGKSSIILAPQNLLNSTTPTTIYESSLLINNPSDVPLNINVELFKEDAETGKLIYDEAEVSLVLDQTTYNAWQRGGGISQNLNATTNSLSKKITTNNVVLNNINILAHEFGKIDLKFNFLTSEYTSKSHYNYHVIIKNAITDSIIGGTTYCIDKAIRNLFYANADDVAVDVNEPITISASEISEPAIYNWYDTDGNLIFTGKDLQTATNVAKTYRLEVIASIDGFKDYSNINVNIKPSILNTITPNPATHDTTISYKLNETTSAYLMVLGSYGSAGTSYNYILDLNSTSTTLDISNYPNGFYTVALICNGAIVDAKTLVKQ